MYDFNKDCGYAPEQVSYAAKANKILSERIGKTFKAAVVTFGCQQNVSDSGKLKGMLELIGYEITEELSEADFIVFNTCAVREHAEDRVFGNVGATKKLKKENPNLMVAVCGCMVQQPHIAEKFRKSYPYVDILFGTAVSHRLPEFIYNKLSSGKRVYEFSLDNPDIPEDVPLVRDSSYKGYIPIMYGWNNFCTYCIVPYVRGRERSRSSAAIVAEAQEMINKGYKEIMLLGQNVNSYGKGLDEDINFAGLLRKINAIEGDFLIRFMTSHPKDCTEELLLAMSECEKVERHLHLPVQSGSDEILLKMNRHYDSEKYLKTVNRARELMPDITFTSDIIVGFPGETYEDFKKTAELVEKVGYLSLFTFIYSKRNGTPAATMPDTATRKEKGAWFNELLAVQDKMGRQIEKSFVGKTVRVLAEETLENGFVCGKTSNGLSVSFKADESAVGNFINVKINEYNNGLSGSVE